uniref:Uncharacterized protein n=1 Tax=Hyaloperonospora arabidopsidis (strain Emoy2) TaxID=559515 RepID=M4BWV9_HYAAE
MSPAVVISCMWITRKKIDGEASSLKAKHIDVQPKFINLLCKSVTLITVHSKP